MSGGSMNYLYGRVQDAEFRETTPLRRAFRLHLMKVAEALRAIEWVDSGDGADENAAIRACVTKADSLRAAVAMAKEAHDALGAELVRAMTSKELEDER